MNRYLFSPANYHGFRFAFFGFSDLGLLSSSNTACGKEFTLLSLGLGLRIRNDNLLFNTLQISLAFFPNPPVYSRINNLTISGEQLLKPNNFDGGKPTRYSFQVMNKSRLYFVITSVILTLILKIMAVLVGKKAPVFSAAAVVNGGEIVEEFSLEQFLGKKYVVFFFYPSDFTFVCPTELLAFQYRIKEFEERNVAVVACSVDSKFSHWKWLQTELNERRHQRCEISSCVGPRENNLGEL